MAFDPDKYLASKAESGGGFDPDKYLSAKAEPRTGAAESALEHFGNAATLGYLPQLQAMAAPAMNRVLDAVTGNHVSDDDKSTYVQLRDENIARQKLQGEEHPYASGAGTLAGIGASIVGTGGLGTVAKGATGVQRLAAATKAGAILGGAANPGDVEGEFSPLQIEDRAKNAGVGAALGAGGQLVGEGLAGIAGKLKGKAEERAFKSAGAMLRDYRKAAPKGQINELGRLMLDEGLVQPGMTVDDIAKAAKALEDNKGAAIGKVIKKLGEKESEVGGQVTRGDIADAVKNRLTQPGEIPSVIKDNKYYAQLSKALKTKGTKELSVDDLAQLKDLAKKQINWKRLPDADIPREEQFNRAIYKEVSDALETRAQELAKRSGNKDYVELKKAYGGAKEINRIASDQALRQNANRFFSPSDYLTSATGAISGAASGDGVEDRIKKAAIGASLGLVNRAARRYGTPLVSHGLDKLGNAVASAQAPANALSRGTVIQLAEHGSQAPVASEALRRVAGDSDAKGEALWARRGAEKLGVSVDGASPAKRRLLIEASDLPANHPRLKRIKEQLSRMGDSNGR
jgi:hypothetical protein